MLGLTGPNLMARLRTSQTNRFGYPPVVTRSKPVPAGQLVHLVYTRSVDGIVRIYANGALTHTSSSQGSLANWDRSYMLALANEPPGDRPWFGDYHLVAIYAQALIAAEVKQNFDAGP
jgi:hypothetical protein